VRVCPYENDIRRAFYLSLLAAVGSNGSILISPDGSDWGTRQTPSTPKELSGIAWSGSMFAAVGEDGAILTSPDGLSWTSRASGTSNRLHGIAWSGTQFAAVGKGGEILTSPDGASWTKHALTTKYDLYGIAWSGEQFIAVGSAQPVASSFDGGSYTVSGGGAVVLFSTDVVTWTAQTVAIPGPLYAVAWSGKQFVAVGTRGAILTSP